MTPHPPPPAPDAPTPGGDPDAEAYDRLRRRVLWAIPTGLFVVGTRGTPAADPSTRTDPATPRFNLMTASLVVQVATDPKLVALALEDGAVTTALVEDSGVFSLSLLERADRALVRKFVKPVADVVVDDAGVVVRMAGVEVEPAPSGSPVLRQALGWVDCAVRHRLPLGSHRLYVAEVTAAAGRPDLLDGSAEVLRMEDTRMSYGG